MLGIYRKINSEAVDGRPHSSKRKLNSDEYNDTNEFITDNITFGFRTLDRYPVTSLVAYQTPSEVKFDDLTRPVDLEKFSMLVT